MVCSDLSPSSSGASFGIHDVATPTSTRTRISISRFIHATRRAGEPKKCVGFVCLWNVYARQPVALDEGM